MIVAGQDYKVWLKGKLIECASLVIDNYNGEYDFRVFDDRDFEKTEGKFEFQDNSIAVIVRSAPAVKRYNVTTYPFSIIFMTEKDDIAVRGIFQKFAENFNLYQTTETSNGVVSISTHNYTAPQIADAFAQAQDGYRATYYISASVITAENVADLSAFEYKAPAENDPTDLYDMLLTFALSYATKMNVEMMRSNQIATSRAEASTETLTFDYPCVKNSLITRVIDQMNGTGNADTSYRFSYTINGQRYPSAANSYFDYKLLSATYSKTAGEAPAISLTFTR